jgi:hypothetical protein
MTKRSRFITEIVLTLVFILIIPICILSSSDDSSVPVTVTAHHLTEKVIDLAGQKRIEESILKVKIGDNIKTVKELLGEPSVQGKIVKKTIMGQMDANPIKTFLAYYFTEGDVNTCEKLFLVFYPDEKLERADSNIPNISIEHLKLKPDNEHSRLVSNPPQPSGNKMDNKDSNKDVYRKRHINAAIKHTTINSLLELARGTWPVCVGALFAFLLWLLQHAIEQNERTKEEKLRRLNYINDLLIECDQNIDIVESGIAKFNEALIKFPSMMCMGDFIGSSLKIGNISKFEKNYHRHFIFNIDLRKYFKILEDEIWKFGQNEGLLGHIPHKEVYKLLNTIKAFKEILLQSKIIKNKYNFDFVMLQKNIEIIRIETT